MGNVFTLFTFSLSTSVCLSALFLLLQNPFDPSYSKYELDHENMSSTSQSIGL